MTTTDTTSTDAMTNDERALELRRQGRSLKKIAGELGLERPMQANAAFNRALRRRTVEEQAEIRAEENGRLNALGDAVRRNSKLTQEDVDRRLRTIDRLRAVLMSD